MRSCCDRVKDGALAGVVARIAFSVTGRRSSFHWFLFTCVVIKVGVSVGYVDCRAIAGAFLYATWPVMVTEYEKKSELPA